MAKPPRDRANTASHTYFVTTNTWEGRALFQSEQVALLLLETLFSYRQQSKFLLHEFALMPDHLHLLITPGPGVTLERAMQYIKGGFSRRAGQMLGRSMEIWQRGYVDHRIRDERDYARHRDYIWRNPVLGKLCLRAEDYPYCSAYPVSSLMPLLRG